MNKTIGSFAAVACFVLGTTFAYADNDAHPGKTHQKWMKEMFAAMDTNADGMISTEEFNDFHAKKFKEFDTNGDGKISFEEMKAGHKKMHAAKHKKMDDMKPVKVDDVK